MIDYLSDTVTKPTLAMREAMFRAQVGDDVYGEDPTVNQLEARAAQILGKPAACFLPSGTMANLTANLAHCPRGYEVLLGNESDLYHYEAGGPSVVGGVVLHPVATEADGTLALERLAEAVRDPEDFQCARAGLICLENPHCRIGGRVLPLAYLDRVRQLADEIGVPIHMDGARIFCAAIALGAPPAEIAARADSLQFCLSKNLAAPVGSIVVGGAKFIHDVRRLRKMLGGGMRQVGFLAAAGLVALETMIDRLADDHRRAKQLARGLAAIPGISLDLGSVETNMVFFRVVDDRFDLPGFLAALAERGIRMGELGHGRIRAVTHWEIDDEAIAETLRIFKELLAPVPST